MPKTERPDADIDVIGTARRLAEILKNDPEGVDPSEFARGDALIVIHQDPYFGANFSDLRSRKLTILELAINDMAEHAKTLSSQVIGLSYHQNKLMEFQCPPDQKPEGSLVFKIALKDPDSFSQWRTGQSAEVDADDVNAIIYRLTVEWSRVL